MARFPSTALALLLLGGCAHVSRAPQQAAEDDACFPAEVRKWGVLSLDSGPVLGGISGVDYDPASKQIVLISDDKGKHGGASVFRGVLSLGADHRIGLTLDSGTALTTPSGPGVDGEAVRFSGKGGLFWASEGDKARGIAPGVFHLAPGAPTSAPVPLPDALHVAPDGQSGPRANRSFEGLSLAKDGSLWIGLEAPLLQEGELPTTVNGAYTSLVHLTPGKADATWYAYPLEPIARQLPGKLADNGLSEMLHLEGDRALVLERSGSQQEDGSFTFVTRLFCAKPGGETLPDGRQAMRKFPVAELNALGPFERTNFEGLSFGPRLPDGSRSLILVSDNGYEAEPTVLLVLRLGGM